MEGTPLTLKGDVGPVTGDVRHDSDVTVTGSVRAGLVVVAGGDLTVFGHVDRAQVHAGGDIHVAGIVSGRDALLDAVGSVRAHQAVDAHVHAGRNIRIDTAAERAELLAGNRIAVRGSPGLIRGGVARAGVALDAVRIEASLGVPCRVFLGENPFAPRRDEIAGRLAFALSRLQKARRAIEEGTGDFRRLVIDLVTYRQLAGRLTRRLRQFDRAASASGECRLTADLAGPEAAEVTYLDGSEVGNEEDPGLARLLEAATGRGAPGDGGREEGRSVG
jgi:hypothetical protein